MAASEAPKLTTADLQALLVARYPADRYALFFDVPDNVGTNQHRRADAIAIGCWSSVGRLIEGFELKVSRGDWLKEFANVSKADPFIERCDKWWLVTSDAAIAKPEEIPACWGWMSVTKGGLRVQRPAQRLPNDEATVNRLFMIGLLRKVSDDVMKDPRVRTAIHEANESVNERVRKGIESETLRMSQRRNDAVAQVEQFEKDSGMKLTDWRLGNVGKLARALADLQEHDSTYNSFDKILERQETAVADLLARIRDARAACAEPAESA